MLTDYKQIHKFPNRFTFPFCYVPLPEIERASQELIDRINTSADLKSLFSEGKMMGVLMVEEKSKAGISFLYAFSGSVGGKSRIDGFVPPIFDLLEPQGYYKHEEAEISALNAEIKNLEEKGGDIHEEIAALKAERKRKSICLQEWIFKQYIVHNAQGESSSIWAIFQERGLIPPGGTGDCAAPKLLEYAYTHGMKPLAMGEFWYGASPYKEIRHQGSFYPSCMGKCGPLLSFMTQGLEMEANPLDEDQDTEADYTILYKDSSIIVVSKPSGMLAVPGKSLKVSLLERLRKDLDDKGIESCHRLDMDTSGVMVFARNPAAKAEISRQFEQRETSKTYIARLSAAPGLALPPERGRIILPIAADYYDRPRQMVDFENGKQAVSDYEVLSVNDDGSIDIRFTPLTGRTHQLRAHSAHPQGLGRPIVGDRLYGSSGGERLHLHAESLTFTHPENGKRLTFRAEAGFLFGK